jgi:hypothetical protein
MDPPKFEALSITIKGGRYSNHGTETKQKAALYCSSWQQHEKEHPVLYWRSNFRISGTCIDELRREVGDHLATGHRRSGVVFVLEAAVPWRNLGRQQSP